MRAERKPGLASSGILRDLAITTMTTPHAPFPSLSLPQPSYSTPTFLTVFTSRLSFRPKDHTLGVRL